MAAKLVEVADETGGSFWVEVEPSEAGEGGDFELVGTPGGQLTARAEELQQLIRRIGRHISVGLEGLAVERAELEVGIRVGGSVGTTWFLAKAEGEAQLKLKIIWSPNAGPGEQ